MHIILAACLVIQNRNKKNTLYCTRVEPVVIIKEVNSMGAATKFNSLVFKTTTTYFTGGHAGAHQIISYTSSSKITNCTILSMVY